MQNNLTRACEPTIYAVDASVRLKITSKYGSSYHEVELSDGIIQAISENSYSKQSLK